MKKGLKFELRILRPHFHVWCLGHIYNLLLLNLMTWRHWAHESHLVPPALRWCSFSGCLICRKIVVFAYSELNLDEFGRVVIRLSQHVTELMNTTVSNSMEDVRLASFLVELLIGHKIELPWWSWGHETQNHGYRRQEYCSEAMSQHHIIVHREL